MRFRMMERNVVQPSLAKAWKDALQTEDLLVEVKVCSSLDGEKVLEPGEPPLCPRASNELGATGVSKLIRLEAGLLRGPVSLPLS